MESGDIGNNTGPKKSSFIYFFLWTLNGLAAHEFV